MDLGYKKHFATWLAGLKDEIAFWKDYMETKGGHYFFDFEETVLPNKQFALECDIPEEFYGKKYDFIDVGSGPFSRCGHITNLVDLRATCVDPLASIYRGMKKKNYCDNGILLQTGFVECLEKKFEENSFDMVHMSNSLDHCFNALDGIYRLLYICRIGGKVILRHAENEAERAHYTGLHQWNLSLNNGERSFILWRKAERIDVCQRLKKYADFELFPNIVENSHGKWQYNKVVMIKKQNIPLDNKEYYNEMLEATHEFLLEKLYDIIRIEEILKKKSVADDYVDKLRELFYNPEMVEQLLGSRGIQKVSIYGLGIIGRSLYHVFQKANIEVVDFIDKKGMVFLGKKAHIPNDYIYDGSSVIVVTVVKQKEEVVKQMLSLTKNASKVIPIEELLF